MSHPAVHLDAIARLRSRLDPNASAGQGMTRPSARRHPGSARRLAGRFTTRLLDRLGTRVAAATERDTEALRAELEVLRAELGRLRSDLNAELAMLRAESAGTDR